ncbi:MAG TPA: hypothetical protein VFZ34_19250 [Blastocatellia bacterium]|nr:hypothetical protein [Blastocatellia bacterium]
MRAKNNKPLTFDDERYVKLKRQIQARSQVMDEVVEQLYQNQLTWLATPLPLHIRLKLRLKRQFRKLRSDFNSVYGKHLVCRGGVVTQESPANKMFTVHAIANRSSKTIAAIRQWNDAPR